MQDTKKQHLIVAYDITPQAYHVCVTGNQLSPSRGSATAIGVTKVQRDTKERQASAFPAGSKAIESLCILSCLYDTLIDVARLRLTRHKLR